MEPGKTIGGRVVDPQGHAVAVAKVFLLVGKKYPGTTQMPDLSFVKTTTDAAGRWSFTGIPAEPVRPQVAAYDIHHLTGDSFTTAYYAPQSALFDGTAELELPAATPVEVQVLTPDGKPAAGATVDFGRDLHVVNHIEPVTTDAEGKITLGWTTGFGRLLTATAPDYGPAQQYFGGSGGQPRHLTPDIAPAANVGSSGSWRAARSRCPGYRPRMA